MYASGSDTEVMSAAGGRRSGWMFGGGDSESLASETATEDFDDATAPVTAVLHAASRGDVAWLTTFLANDLNPLGLIFNNSDGETAVHVAAREGHAEFVSLLLAAVTAVDPVGGERFLSYSLYPTTPSPFALALYRGHRRVLKVLLRAGADVDVHSGNTKRNDDNADAWALVDAINKVASGNADDAWPRYVRHHTTILKNVVSRIRNHEIARKIPNALILEIVAYLAPPGGY